MRRPVALEAGDHHDYWMNQIGAVGQATEGNESFERQEVVDRLSELPAARDDDPNQSESPRWKQMLVLFGS